jgi:hypothetical protein
MCYSVSHLALMWESHLQQSLSSCYLDQSPEKALRKKSSARYPALRSLKNVMNAR